METKEIKNALVANIKNELKDFTQVQRDLKKSRKLEFRQGKDLQDICDEIANNRDKITFIIFYYRWIKHGLKYWNNRGIHNLKEYKYSYNDEVDVNNYWYKNWDTVIQYGSNKGKTHGEVIIEYAKEYYIELCNKYNIEYTNENINDLILNYDITTINK